MVTSLVKEMVVASLAPVRQTLSYGTRSPQMTRPCTPRRLYVSVTSVRPIVWVTEPFWLGRGSLSCANAAGANAIGASRDSTAAKSSAFFMHFLLVVEAGILSSRRVRSNGDRPARPYGTAGSGGLPAASRRQEALEHRSERQDQGAPDQVEPQVADVGGQVQGDNGPLGQEGGQEYRRPAHPPDQERGQEQAEDGAVEERAQDVEGLDQVLGQAGRHGEGEGHHAPERRQSLRHEHVVALAQARAEQALVDVDRRGRAEGVELRGGRRHAGAEDHRDQETDDTARKMLHDERQEDVVGVLGVHAGGD